MLQQLNWEVGKNPTLPPQRCSRVSLSRQSGTGLHNKYLLSSKNVDGAEGYHPRLCIMVYILQTLLPTLESSLYHLNKN